MRKAYEFKQYFICRLTGMPDFVSYGHREHWNKIMGRVGVFSEAVYSSHDFQQRFYGCYDLLAKFYVPPHNRTTAMNTHYWGAYYTLDGALEYPRRRHWLIKVIEE